MKFSLTHFNEGFIPEDSLTTLNLSLADQWIISRFNKVSAIANNCFENYQFGDLTNSLYDFWLKELCDVYIEAMKAPMQGSDENAKKAARNTLYYVVDGALKLIHPIMPYITEELYHKLPHNPKVKSESISIAPYPTGL